ncbi:hypothetical protein MRX96_046349 [Rhipicephalus microplus]
MGYLAMSIGFAPAVVHLRTKRMIVVTSEQCAIDAGNAATWHECVEGGEPRLEERSSTMPFFAGQPVWLRSFHSRPKWLPGVVTSTQGARMATLSTPDGEQRRHANQLRLRTPKDSNMTQPGGATTSTTTANETLPMPAGMADTTPAGSLPSSQPEALPPLRRSNRLRRPPQRFNW